MKIKRVLPEIILLVSDVVVSWGAVHLAKYLQFLLPEVCLPDELLGLKAGVYSAVTVLIFYFQDLYDWRFFKRISELASSILLAEGLCLIILAFLFFVIPSVGIERDVLFMAIGITIVGTSAVRYALTRVRGSRYAGIRVVLFGDGENAKFLFREMRSSGYPVLFEGYVGKVNWDLPLKRLGPAEEVRDIVERHDPDMLVVAPDGWRGTLPVEDLLKIKLSMCEVVDAPTFYERVTGRILVEEIRPSSIIFTEGYQSSRLQDIVKRAFDLVFAVVGLVLCAPVMLLTALAIRLDSPGPVFYFQNRVGKDGRDFKVIKFRSMYKDAEKDGPKWASEHDPRITRVGRIIRKLRIDELPQFINVIKNDMSFVGPRPERRFFVDQLEKAIPFYALRLHAKPGITGWAQINYPYGDTFDDAKEKLKYELYYMKHRSLWLDLVIIFQTIKIALKGRGAQ
ncbi:MAG TPA: sugar transferase [Deltaproteobacteria bacterium]|nr:sugar transferase [Deltaproteobacteria bacterium]HOM28681.1 sugar transferase [Deltaproteobacteria bacterium]HPP80169.1 sugar transferase [Deltaproteobacteria bacterium]